MSEHNEQVEPVAFDTADSPVAQQQGRSGPIVPPPAAPQPTPRWVFPALGGLLLLAVVVVFWLPGKVEVTREAPKLASDEALGIEALGTEALGTQGIPGPVQAAQTTTEETAEERSPWSDAQQAQLRAEAQEALQALLDLQFQLDETGAATWAPESYPTAIATAQRGDREYREREFGVAKASYLEGAAQMQALLDSMPALLAGLLSEAESALDSGDTEDAIAAAEKALLIEPGNARAETALVRAATLPQVLELLDQAEDASAINDFEDAIALLDQALALDPSHAGAAEARQVAQSDLTRQRFNEAMTQGYIALENGDWSSARDHFRKAAGIYPGSPETGVALQEVESGETAERLGRLQRQGQQAESEERWADAVKAYETTLQIDRSIVFASDGYQRSAARARLDELLVTAIAEPSRLADDKVFAATESVLRQAQTIGDAGPRLTRQLDQLQTIMSWASKPIPVTLRSDNVTEIIVYKVARLGRFEQQELQLKPGTYTAVGSRAGFRDVRQSIEVSHEAPPPVVTIACTEPI